MFDNYKDEYRDKDFAEVKVQGNLPLHEQDKIIAELYETIIQLTSKLNFVLLPAEEKTTNETPVEENDTLSSPLSIQIQDNNQRIMNANRRIQSLIDRIEC